MNFDRAIYFSKCFQEIFDVFFDTRQMSRKHEGKEIEEIIFNSASQN